MFGSPMAETSGITRAGVVAYRLDSEPGTTPFWYHGWVNTLLVPPPPPYW